MFGMVDEEERNSTIEEPPVDEDHDAHIAWDGQISLRYGNAVIIWLTIGLLLLVMATYERAQNKQKLADSEE